MPRLAWERPPPAPAGGDWPRAVIWGLPSSGSSLAGEPEAWSPLGRLTTFYPTTQGPPEPCFHLWPLPHVQGPRYQSSAPVPASAQDPALGPRVCPPPTRRCCPAVSVSGLMPFRPLVAARGSLPVGCWKPPVSAFVPAASLTGARPFTPGGPVRSHQCVLSAASPKTVVTGPHQMCQTLPRALGTPSR